MPWGDYMKRVYFIDYENVDTPGFDGLSGLTPQDDVYIFYSERHSRMSFGLHRRLCESSAVFHYEKVVVPEGVKQVVDDRIREVADKVICDKRADYYIITNDGGYKKFMNSMLSKGYKVFQAPNIKSANDKKREEIIRIIDERLINGKKRAFKLEKNHVDKIVSFIMKSYDKGELNRNLQTIFSSEQTGYVLKQLKDLTYEM